LININKTTRLASEIKYNGIAIDSSLISNANLVVEQINGTSQNYTPQIDDGIIYVDGSFNKTGIYYLDWTATYLNQTRTAREIVVVVGWEELLEDINETVNVELLNLIKDNRLYLIQLLTDMEYLQQFSEEEIFLITDSVNSMSKVINYLQGGKMTNEEAEQQFDQIRSELENKLGIQLTGSAIGIDMELQKPASPFKKLAAKFSDWKSIMFTTLLLIFAMLMVVILMLTKMRQIGYEKQPMKQIEVKRPGKRRYQILIDRIKQRRKSKEIQTEAIEQTETVETNEDYTRSLDEFLTKAISEGHTKGSIKISLINKGWPVSFVDAYCDRFFEKKENDFKRKVYK